MPTLSWERRVSFLLHLIPFIFVSHLAMMLLMYLNMICFAFFFVGFCFFHSCIFFFWGLIVAAKHHSPILIIAILANKCRRHQSEGISVGFYFFLRQGVERQ